MTLMQTASKLNTANQLDTWNKQAITAINSAKEHFNSILTQRDAMIDNPDYSEDDINEVNEILLKLNEIAISLTK